MAATPSTMLPLGTKAPDFALKDPSGKLVRLSDAKQAKATLVMFICNHCPYVKHVRHELARLGQDYQARGVAIFALNSNDADKYPDDGPEAMAREIREVGYTFPYLIDETQAVAKAYNAACTPDFFLFDGAQKLVYRGQLDGARPKNDVPVDGRDLRAALDAVLANKPVSTEQRASIGCNIKWKPGNAPAYFG